MMTILDIDETSVLSELRLQEWEEQFQMSFREPELIIRGVMSYLQMTEDERDMFREESPDIYAKVIRAVGRAPITGGQYG